MAIERSELRLVWPSSLFASEARALLAADADDDTLGGLLVEAFYGGRGEQLLQQVAREHPHRPWTPTGDVWGADEDQSFPILNPVASRATAQLVAELAEQASSLPVYAPRPLYRQRHRPRPPRVLNLPDLKVAFARLVIEMAELGYFEDAFGSQCDDYRGDQAERGQRQLAERLGVDGVTWPFGRVRAGVTVPGEGFQGWSDELLYEVIEALDEVVARPRERSWHDYHGGWDYADYTRPAGQVVYRWRVNELLATSVVSLRLATRGSDAGLLVHATGDARDDLVEQVLLTPGPDDRKAVSHALGLFRARGADREAKRSAVVALARVLEQRRTLLHGKLGKKDEGVLFRIANEFDLRHRRADQHRDYDEAYLDWVFWWYLATVELSDRLIARDAAGDR